MKPDTIVHAARPVEIRHRQQQQYFLNKTSEECGIITRCVSDEEDNNFRHNSCETSMDDDSTIDLQPKLFIVEVPVQNIRDYSRSASDDSDLKQMCIITSRIYDSTRSARRSQRRYHSNDDHHRGSRHIQHSSHTTYKESDDEGSPSSTNYRNAVRSRQKISNLSREQESIDPSCMPSIVTAIDSGRESDIIWKNSLRRTNSRNKKIRNRCVDLVIKAENDDECFENQRRTLSRASSYSHDKPVAYLVTEF